jgi:DNA-binding FadR family transcriptional regulator
MKASFTPVGAGRTFERAVEQIAEQVRYGFLTTGDRLPAERDLASAMQISRATLREAVKVLADAGVLEVRKGSASGTYVASEFAPRELVRSRSSLRMEEVGGVLEARRLLEPRVAQVAAAQAGDADFKALQRTIDGQKSIVESGDVLAHEDEFLQLDTRFHMLIARATGNATLVSLVRTVLRQFEIARDLAMHEAPTAPWVVGIHESTLEAIRSGDQGAVERVMDEHLSTTERAWERAAGRPLVRPLPPFMEPLAKRSTSIAEN